MKVGLLAVDCHRWPTLCLMKLSAYHKARGDRVEWWRSEGQYDLVYKSKVFTDLYSKDTFSVTNADTVIRGGTGYGTGPNLPDAVEHSRPDYSIYPAFPDTAYGFLTRGCPRNCSFCIVSRKEGRKSVQTAELSEFWNGQRTIKLLDANLLACPEQLQAAYGGQHRGNQPDSPETDSLRVGYDVRERRCPGEAAAVRCTGKPQTAWSVCERICPHKSRYKP